MLAAILEDTTNDDICEQKELPVKTDGCGVKVSTNLNTINNRVSGFLSCNNHKNARLKLGYLTIIKTTIVSTRF
jgi:hypothetical protein